MSDIEPIIDLSRIAIHTATTKPLAIEQAVEKYAELGFGGVSVWDDVVDAAGTGRVRALVQGAGLRVPALVRGGFFVSADPADRAASIGKNRHRIRQAAEIGAEMVVLVAGAEPGVPLESAREQATAGIAAILPEAERAGVKLAIEPLHPMYAADRCCINRIADARAVCEALASPLLGVAVDVYHVWWDPDLEREIEALGRTGRLLAFHVCDWKADTGHLLLDRGLMGDGVIDLRRIRGMVERAGFDGLIEVEIFSKHYWAMDQDRYLELIAERARTCV
ncbi:MAG: sugar phosphate isomerase/epimerase [Phycisphaeraceae bacterium]|nr:MAG: sugar phosphate isomerase/epimerase [Phycisphaeraceae bacterium]